MIYIILPSFNEEKNLIKIIKKIEFLNKKLKSKVILVDDGSNDATEMVVTIKYSIKIQINFCCIFYNIHCLI